MKCDDGLRLEHVDLQTKGSTTTTREKSETNTFYFRGCYIAAREFAELRKRSRESLKCTYQAVFSHHGAYGEHDGARMHLSSTTSSQIRSMRTQLLDRNTFL